ncbi:hypothetical protein [Prauserella cavernicola]|uniref:Uncharacterized protein n=1 Tax=Prauserella cavernicola TaxID=2800127 RepID=A0A934QSM2_9PSEU|nr:hypothetical protein [Prauserella cavernicola]MBK1785582.1 hypothetical protein [Prauserella cavernicola]
MLTLAFLWTWAKVSVVALLAVVIERAMIPSPWAFTTIATITVLIYLVICAGLFREWRSHAAGYHHQMTSIRREHTR